MGIGIRGTFISRLWLGDEKTKLSIKLKMDDGNWCSDKDTLKDLICSHFRSLFTQEGDEDLPACETRSVPTLTDIEKGRLCSPVTMEEVKRAVDSMGSLKAPGPDGVQALFYQDYWHLVGTKIFDLVSKAFEEGTVPDGMNQTLITLIPKVEGPTSVSHYRPISLCNVTYKIITTVLVNRLRPLLSKILSPSQSSFVPGRNTTDKKILTQELMHSFRKKKGKDGNMAFKIDLEKAYD